MLIGQPFLQYVMVAYIFLHYQYGKERTSETFEPIHYPTLAQKENGQIPVGAGRRRGPSRPSPKERARVEARADKLTNGC